MKRALKSLEYELLSQLCQIIGDSCAVAENLNLHCRTLKGVFCHQPCVLTAVSFFAFYLGLDSCLVYRYPVLFYPVLFYPALDEGSVLG